jgi:hypothetical protein
MRARTRMLIAIATLAILAGPAQAGTETIARPTARALSPSFQTSRGVAGIVAPQFRPRSGGVAGIVAPQFRPRWGGAAGIVAPQFRPRPGGAAGIVAPQFQPRP